MEKSHGTEGCELRRTGGERKTTFTAGLAYPEQTDASLVWTEPSVVCTGIARIYLVAFALLHEHSTTFLQGGCIVTLT